jgi:predicted nucleic acid-binding protein
MADPPDPGPRPLPLFGAGEAEAIALAAHLGVRLLINERPAAQFAARMGVTCFTVPSLVVALRARDVISARAARRKLALIEPITARPFLDDARRALDSL